MIILYLFLKDTLSFFGLIYYNRSGRTDQKEIKGLSYKKKIAFHWMPALTKVLLFIYSLVY